MFCFSPPSFHLFLVKTSDGNFFQILCYSGFRYKINVIVFFCICLYFIYKNHFDLIDQIRNCTLESYTISVMYAIL